MNTILRPLFRQLPEGAQHWVRLRLLGTPTSRLFDDLARHGVALKPLRTLEVFGGSGAMHTRDYHHRVGPLEIWELDPVNEPLLRARFPRATVRITDSYQEIRRTPDRFGLVVVDNPFSTYGEHYCDHFQLFPDLFRVLEARAVVVLNVTPSVTPEDRARYPYLFNDAELAQRRAFYRTDHPESLTQAELAARYAELAGENGFRLLGQLWQPRTFVHYLALVLERQDGR